MRPRALVALVLQSLWRARGSLGLAAFGVTVGIGALSFFLSLSEGMRAALHEVFPAEQIEVERASGDGGPLGLLGGAPPALTDQDLDRIRAIPGVKNAYPRLRLAFPTKAWGGENLLQGRRYTELIGDGVPAALIDDLPASAGFGDVSGESSGRACTERTPCPEGEHCDTASGEGRCARNVPVLVSPYLMELYNDFVAPRSDLPQINRWMVDRVRGLTFTVRLGESYVGAASCVERGACTPRNVQLELVGVSRHAVNLGVTVPIEYAQRWNREYGGDEAAARYGRAVVETESEDAVTPVVAQIRRLGFDVPATTAQQAGITITIITALLALTSALIILVAAVNIAHTFFSLVHERRREIGLYRALGATRGDVRNILLGEAAVVGLVSGLAGLLLAAAAARFCDYLWVERVPDFPFKPESLFAFDPGLVALALGFAVGCCLVGAYLPARRAARLDPARSLG